MKPTFALDLTRDVIALLHRTPKGWLSIGEVAFDAPDLDAAVDYLRKTALGLSPMGMAIKIVLPASQILYTEVHAPGPSRDDKRRQIAAGLEGRTPYAVEDLVFDWSGKGATVKVAVVARETLDEAEAFAVGHRLNPVSFVAIPEDGSFVGEPWFGPTAAAEASLPPGESVDRDREPVTILHRDPPVAEQAPEPTGEPAGATAPEPVADLVPTADPEDPLPGLEEALNADLPDTDAPTAARPVTSEPLTPDLEDQGDALPGGQFPAPADPIAEAAPETAPAQLASAALPPIEADPATAASVSVAVEPPRADPDADEAPFAHVTDTAAFPEDEDTAPAPGVKRTSADKLDDDIPPAPPSAAMVAFASRRSAPAAAPGVGTATGAVPGPARPVDGASRTEGPVAKPAALAGRPAPAKGFAGLVTAPSIPGTRAKPKAKLPTGEIARPAMPGPTTVKSPARPGGTFGTSAPPRSRSGIVFMVLVALLLLFLALVAAWASFYLKQAENEAAAATSLALDGAPVAVVPGEALAADAIPGVDDEMLADMQDPEGMTAPLPEAQGEGLAAGDAGALATESLPVNIGGEDEAAPSEIAAADPVLTDPAPAAPDLTAEAEAQAQTEPAPQTTVTTELATAATPVEDQDEIFLSSMDAPPPALDALALPTPLATLDAAPELPMPPPALGTVYQFDANGLLLPTPEGILSPDGVMLIAGKPPLLPPARSDIAAAAAVAAAQAAEPPVEAAPDAAAAVAGASLVPTEGATAADEASPAPADPAMAGFRPRPRPEGLTPETPDDAALTAPTATEVVTLRPLARPESVLVAASASRPSEGTATADLGAQGASLAAQAEAKLAAAAALEAENPSIVAISMRPAARPRDLSDAVEAAVAAAVRAPEPEAEVIEIAAAPPADLKPEELDELDEPETASTAPSIPTKASVAKQATFSNAINLSKINLIGTYGTDSRRYALIRQSNGRYKKVKVGDKIDGGTVKAITETEVRYQKGGKLVALKMPKA